MAAVAAPVLQVAVAVAAVAHPAAVFQVQGPQVAATQPLAGPQ
jgi:hypothetical protein